MHVLNCTSLLKKIYSLYHIYISDRIYKLVKNGNSIVYKFCKKTNLRYELYIIMSSFFLVFFFSNVSLTTSVPLHKLF